MRIASLIVLLIASNTTYSGFSGTTYSEESAEDIQPSHKQSAIVDVRMPIDMRDAEPIGLEVNLLRAAGPLATSYKKLIDARCSTLETAAVINLTKAAYITTMLPVDLKIPVHGAYFNPVALRMQIVLDVCQREGEPLTYLLPSRLENTQNELVPVEFIDARTWVKEFAPLPNIPLPSLHNVIREEPITVVLHQVICLFFSAALLLATIRDYQLTSALLQKQQNRPSKKITRPVS